MIPNLALVSATSEVTRLKKVIRKIGHEFYIFLFKGNILIFQGVNTLN